jgi:hypothetical protein
VKDLELYYPAPDAYHAECSKQYTNEMVEQEPDIHLCGSTATHNLPLSIFFIAAGSRNWQGYKNSPRSYRREVASYAQVINLLIDI